MMKGLIGITMLVLLLWTASVYSSPILFEFSGRFGDCQEPCDDPSLSGLGQQEYSGSLVIPASAIGREPDGQNRPNSNEMIWSYYELSGNNARLDFDTIGTDFDVMNGTPINTIVSLCDAINCPFNDNFIWFTFIGPNYSFTLNFGTVSDPSDHSSEIPDIDGYSIFRYLGFEVYRNDFGSSIRTNQLSSTETDMEISISHLKTEPTQVPIGIVSSFLMSLIVCACGLQGLRGERLKITT